MIGFYHSCPANSALLIFSGKQINNKSIKRLAKKNTWTNPFKENVFVVDLSPITFNYKLHLPVKPSGELLLLCQITTQIDSLDENIKTAACKGYGSNQEANVAKLKAIIKRIKVTQERLPPSLESFCTNSRERELSKISKAIEEALQQEGFFLYSFAPTSITDAKSSAKANTLKETDDLSYCSQMLRELKFEPYIFETKIALPAREPYWGAQTLIWQITARSPASIDQYSLACKTFLHTSANQAENIFHESVAKALLQAVQISGADRLLERALSPLANLPLSTCSSGREVAVMLLNALATSLATWRGKLAISRLALDTISTLTRLDKEIDLQTAENFAALGLVLEKISLISINSNQQAEPWKEEPSADETIIRLELPLPIKLEEDNKNVTLVLKCLVSVEQREKEKIDSKTLDQLAQLFTENLTTALSSVKVTRAVAVVKKLVENIHSELEHEEQGGKWETKIEGMIKDIGPTGIVFNGVRILFASLDAYNDVRKRFLASSEPALHSHRLTIKYFSLEDLDLLDTQGQSLFVTN